ncbi:uncharacterized protein LOC103155170 isoform X1 [Poecilia formosa]|uniref:uncharacterized protein LOC103155170 isoform X1 n=1 Tax=Poecilia formosa TaxID=48698 RepID=UPI000443988C|nr:PREDICTED: uncharacterized protein LOC103155170 isoform X1 [Poecilia formosa]XP_016518827.1 PREDICTED: uncharacterized protein LOC103155170 isoform X1 [Poecilia formosa]
MEMWLKSAIVALLTVIGATLVLTSEIQLNLEKTNDTGRRERRVSPGSSLKLHCCLTQDKPDRCLTQDKAGRCLTQDKAERCHVSWYFQSSGKNLTEMDTEKPLCNWTIVKDCNLSDICHNMPCDLSNINESDIGWYYCKVKIDIPTLRELESSKTKVIVENLKEKTTVQSQTTKSQVTSQKEENDQNENLWMWIIVGASSFVLVLTALLVACVVRKRGCSRSIEEPVYVNTRLGKPSPRLMPADNPKSVSASQDLRTPISARRYEGRNQRYKH